jgi:hypothetical protein
LTPKIVGLPDQEEQKVTMYVQSLREESTCGYSKYESNMSCVVILEMPPVIPALQRRHFGFSEFAILLCVI